MGGVGPCVRGASLSRSQASDAESQAVPLLRIRRWRACLAFSVLPKSSSQLVGEPSREGGVFVLWGVEGTHPTCLHAQPCVHRRYTFFQCPTFFDSRGLAAVLVVLSELPWQPMRVPWDFCLGRGSR